MPNVEVISQQASSLCGARISRLIRRTSKRGRFVFLLVLQVREVWLAPRDTEPASVLEFAAAPQFVAVQIFIDRVKEISNPKKMVPSLGADID